MFVFIQKLSELGSDCSQDDAVCRRRLSIFLDQGNINKRRRSPQICSGRGWCLSVLCVLIIPGGPTPGFCSKFCTFLERGGGGRGGRGVLTRTEPDRHHYLQVSTTGIGTLPKGQYRPVQVYYLEVSTTGTDILPRGQYDH